MKKFKERYKIYILNNKQRMKSYIPTFEEFLFLNEEEFGKIEGVEIYKNPKSLSQFPANCRAASDYDGNLYVLFAKGDDTRAIHVDILHHLAIRNVKKLKIHRNWEDVHHNYKNAITWQRDGKSKTFKLAESYQSSQDTKTEFYHVINFIELFKKLIPKAQRKNPQFKFSYHKIDEESGNIMTNTKINNKTFISSGSGVYSMSHQFAQQVRDLRLQIKDSDDEDEIDLLKKQIKELEDKIKKESK